MKELMMKSLVLFFFLSSQQGYAADKEAGEKKFESVCFACHGPQGKSQNPLWPNLYGQKDQYLIKQLEAFQSGNRIDPLMSPQAKLLSPDDIENVAAYLSHLK